MRLIQGRASPRWGHFLPNTNNPSHHNPRNSFSFAREAFPDISEELADRLAEMKNRIRLGPAESKERLMMFPELYVPPHYVSKLKHFVRETGVAILAGLMLRELPRAVPVTSYVRQLGIRI